MTPAIDTSRRDTTAAKVAYVANAGIFARLGSRAWRRLRELRAARGR